MNGKIKLISGDKKIFEIQTELSSMNIVDIAETLEEKNKQEMAILFRLLTKDVAGGVFSYLSPESQQFLIGSFSDKETAEVLDGLFIDDTVDMIEEMPADIVRKILKNTDIEDRSVINQLLQYPEFSAGSLMTTEYVDFMSEVSVGNALNKIKQVGLGKETINTCYVVDKQRRLEGVVSIRKLILNEKRTLIKNIMDTECKFVFTTDSQEDVANMFKKYDLLYMPVVDAEKKLVGLITVDDIVHIIDQENTEDMHIMAAIQPLEKEYLRSSVFSLAKSRIAWLMILMISATFTSIIIQNFENLLEAVVVLTAFIPMLMDTGGNAGSQSSVLVIRGLALGEIRKRDIFKILWKEFRVSLIVGFALASVNFLRLYLFEGRVGLRIMVTVSSTLFFTVVLAKVVGGMLPILAKLLKLDPAIMASPLITTIVDVFSLFIYFTFAKILLGL